MTQNELKVGDSVIPKQGRGVAPRVIASFGSQPSMFGPETQVAVFEDGSFTDISGLQAVASGPVSTFDRKLRLLAEAAMSVCHHDCGECDPEWHYEVEAMERKFRKILRPRG